MHIFKKQIYNLSIYHSRKMCTQNVNIEKSATVSARSSKLKLKRFLTAHPEYQTINEHIPKKYFSLTRKTPADHLYLIDSEIAKKASKYIIPCIPNNKKHLVCESNVGLGLITSALLKNNLNFVRMYENCPEFREYLMNKFKKHSNRIELISRDFFLLHRYDYLDKFFNGNGVDELLEGVPKQDWNDDPVMTIIGAVPDQQFLRYLLKSLIFQMYPTSFGRIQLFLFTLPKDYIKLTAGPDLNLHTYQKISVLFNLFFETELLEKIPEEVFLPWISSKQYKKMPYAEQIDRKTRYFVKINFRKNLPVSSELLLPLYVFVRQFFGRGNNRIVPTLEKWIPGCGPRIMIPTLGHDDYFPTIGIYTTFGELSPTQILAVFKECVNTPNFEVENFINMIEADLIRSETIETGLDDHLSEKTSV